jgi:hypothetical protein
MISKTACPGRNSEEAKLRKHVSASWKGRVRPQKRSNKYGDLELEIAAVSAKLGHIYNEVTLLTETLKDRQCGQSSGDAFEVEVMLKNALRVLHDAMLHLPC